MRQTATTLGAFRSSDVATIAIDASGVLTITSAYTIAQANSGTSDAIDTITPSLNGISSDDSYFIMIEAYTGHTVTLNHGTGNLTLKGVANIELTGGQRALLFGSAANGYTDFAVSSGGGSGSSTPNFDSPAIKTIVSGVVATGTDRNLVIAAESGTVDDLIEITGLTVGDKVLLRADAGNTITVKHNDVGATVKILIQDDTDFVLDEVHPLELILVATNQLAQVYDEVGAGGSSTALLNTADGRLTLTSNTPVTTSNVTAATTIYYTPYTGNQIALYDVGSSTWAIHTFTERSLAVPANTNTNHDVFIWNNAGTITLEAVAWTNDTTRATALVRQNGVYVKTGETNKRYLGSFRTTGVSGQCEDGVEKRFVWNVYNRVLREGRSKNSNTGITYATAAWRELNNGTGQQRFQYVLGLAEDALQLGAYFNSSTTGGAFIAIGIDAVNGSVQLCPTAWSGGEIVGVQGGDISMTGVSDGNHFGTIIEFAASSTLTNSGGDSTLAKFGVWM